MIILKTIHFLIAGLASISFANQLEQPKTLQTSEISVVGEALKKSAFDVSIPVSEISGAQLERKKKSTLGETISSELGVSSSFFGPNSSRPVIRGQDGDRIKILSNGMGVLDASAASQDHGTAIDPLIIDRIEVVRGPSALLYGNSAVGGVINTVSNRIAEKSLLGFNGRFNAIATSVDQGKSGGLSFNYGLGRWVFHIDAFNKNLKDYKVPGFARTEATRQSKPLNSDEVEGFKTVPNSANQTSSGALGVSYIFDNGFAGTSQSLYESEYGTVVKQGVTIKMKQQRNDVVFGLKDLGWIQTLRLKNSYSDYKHSEIEGGSVGTTFTNRGNETRLEMTHQKVGDWSGIFGLQNNVNKFSAIGDESFLPSTLSTNQGLFFLEEAQFSSWKPSVGLRLEKNIVQADQTFIDTNPGSAGESSLNGPTSQRNFQTISSSVGTVYSLDDVQSLAFNLSQTERAPNYQELYANGPHLATGSFERGNTQLGKEKSQAVEASYRFKDNDRKGSIGFFLQDFKDYIALSPQTGGGFDPGGAPGNRDLTLYQYEAVDAQFYGAEFEVSKNYLGLIPGGSVEFGFKFDMVKARNKTAQTNLPRITPSRQILSAEYKTEKYTSSLEVQMFNAQKDTAPNEEATAAYSLVNASLETVIATQDLILTVFGRANNLFDTEARSHVSFLKSIAPLPGRNIQIGIQGNF